jgi:small subunit ribosomal protein S1
MSWSKVISQVALQIHRKKVYWNHILQTRQQVFRSASFCLNTTKSTGGITMSEELKTSEELAAEAETSAAETPEITETAAPEEPAETMADYAEELEASFKQIHEGDILTGTVIGVSESEITLDLKYYTEGIIRLEDFTSDPGFNLKEDVHIGDEISATVIRRDDGEGHILLSSKEANDILAWDKFKKYMEEGTNLTVKVGGIVKSGVVAYLDGIRGFIPASRLSLNYVEEDALNDWLGKELEVRVINADTENKRLVLSAREILREKADEERKAKVSNVQVGLVTEGTVETIKPYGAFINLGNGLSGLLHVSQICEKRIKTPAAVLSEGDTVKVKITAIKDGKLSLSMKALNDVAAEEVEEETFELPETEAATTSLGSLFKNIKL